MLYRLNAIGFQLLNDHIGKGVPDQSFCHLTARRDERRRL